MLTLSWLTLIRQPARSALAILGVAAVGALLFDMLLLSRGLVLSFRDLLDRAGFDIRVLATDAPPFSGPLLTQATALGQALGRLPEVESVLQLRLRDAEIADAPTPSSATAPAADASSRLGREDGVQFIGVDPQARSMWTMVSGQDLPRSAGARPTLVINRNIAREAGLVPGSAVALRCAGDGNPLPAVTFVVSGVVDFPFDDVRARTAAGTLRDAATLCGGEDRDEAEMLLVRSRPGLGASTTAAAIQAAHPGLYVITNEDLVERFSRVEFSYFRQISAVLATVTLFFGFLLIGVLLTVSVNQRLGEIAALRALGLSRWRVMGGILIESVLLVFAGGVLAVPLGMLLSLRLDAILRAMPGVPADLHFFVFEPRALVLHVGLLAVASLAAAAYPMRIVATLPIAETLRREVVS
ncbi:MAG: FtsX-like permease family protein [Vicinamibacterales bacterium]